MSIRKLDVDREKKVERPKKREQNCDLKSRGQGHPYHNLKQSVQIYFLYWLLQSFYLYVHTCMSCRLTLLHS